MIFVNIIPKISILAAARLRPIPSVHEITAKKDAFLQQIQSGVQKAAQDWYKANVPKPGDDPKVYQEKAHKWLEDYRQEVTRQIDETNSALERDYQAKKRVQVTLAINISRISPASALAFSTMSLARTGLDEHERFLASIRAYKRIFSKWVGARMMRNMNIPSGDMGNKVVLDDMPKYDFDQETLAESLARTLPDIALMFVLTIAFFAGAYFSFLKYDVR